MAERPTFEQNQTSNMGHASPEPMHPTSGQFRELTFQPETGVDVVATSAEDLVAAKIHLSPEFIAKAWSPSEADRYRELQKAERQNGDDGVK